MVEPSVLDNWESALNGVTQFYELEDMDFGFFQMYFLFHNGGVECQ